MKKLIAATALFITMAVEAQQPATVKEYQKAFPTYPFSDPNPIPLLTPVYPYFRFDGFTDKPVQKEWKVVELENAWIKLLILPEIGGKIWAAIEKSTDRPFLYYNHAVKFRDIAMRGPWTSGGLEANYGIIGHTPNCATPVDYVTRANEDGSVSCIIGTLDLLTRTYWRMEINVPKDKAYFTTRSFWYNTTGTQQPYYHWMNAGLKVKGGLEFIYPGNKYLGHEGEYADWPVNASNGKQINFYDNNDFGGYKSYHVFGKYTDFTGAYYHDDQMGMVRYGAHDDKPGKKLWIWGLSRQGMIWEKLLTDTDGQYWELQSGRLFNQSAEKSTFTPFKHTSISPAQTDTWKEYWYPVLRTKGFVAANQFGALNLTVENGWLKVRFSAAQTLDEKIEVREGDKLIYSKAIVLAPMKLFADSVRTTADPSQLTAILGNHLLEYQSDPEATTLARPVDTPTDFDWNSTYGLYLQGEENMDQKLYPQAEEKLRASLAKDHNFLPTLVKLATLCYRNMRYAEGLELAKRALSIDSYDGGANYIYALLNLQLGHRVDARDGFDIATQSPEFRSAAYTGIARMLLQDGDYLKAAQYAEKAIDANKYNMDARQIEAIAWRKLQNDTHTENALKELSSLDALDHFARFERYMKDASAANRDKFTSLIRNELPQETYTEMAIWYYNAGQKNEAIQLFRLCPPNAETACWLAWLEGKPLDLNTLKPDFSFPFRSETAQVMEDQLKKQENWFLKYQLALIYKDRNRVEEAKGLLASCGTTPEYAPFYAVRAAINGSGDPATAEADLKKALSLDNQWRYHKALAEFYISQRQFDKALAITDPYYKAHPDSYIMGSLQAKALLLNGKYAEADAILTKIQVIPFEGATGGHELYRQAKLMQAMQQMEKKNTKGALALIDQARQWPENLGVGKPYEENIDSRLEDWLSYDCYMQQKDKVKAEAMLHQVLLFNPKVENTVSNFYPSNSLITAMAYERNGEKDKGIKFLADMEKAHPGSAGISWSRDVFEGEQHRSVPEEKKESNLLLIEEMLKRKL
jgi:hypothetical protein